MSLENDDLILVSWFYTQGIPAAFRVEINIKKIVTFDTNNTDQQAKSTEVVNILYTRIGGKIFSYVSHSVCSYKAL